MHPSATGSALLERVYAQPDDDRPRRVYADWLEEQGDPRGPFISLQLDRAHRPLEDLERRREFALLSQHGGRWLQPLDPLLLAPVFERGFLAACTLESVPPWAVGVPAWSTVERLTYAGPDQERLAELVMHPSLRALRLLAGPGPRALEALAATASQGGPSVLQLHHVLGAGQALRLGGWHSPRLVEVRLLAQTPEWSDVLSLLSTPLGRRLARLEVRRLELELELSRDDEGRPELLASCRTAAGLRALGELCRLLPEPLAHLELHASPRLADELDALGHPLEGAAEEVEVVRGLE